MIFRARQVGLDGVAAFVEMSRANSGCDVWQQNLTHLELPEARFDAVFCNACLFHVPSSALPKTLEALTHTLRPGGVLFVSNAHGFANPRNPRHFGTIEGGRNSVSGGRTTRDTQSL